MIKVVFMGTPDVALPVLDKLNQSPENEIVSVYTAPDRQSGRGKSMTTVSYTHLTLPTICSV